MCFQKVRKIRITEKAAAEHYHYKVMISNQLVANYWQERKAKAILEWQLQRASKSQT